ncbi:hypothetical protein ZWY2020_047995 [Hordeum vulgare]|nr:hypothetical protein ZWY2020_047995 [Hordeum vulgare]
MATHARLHRRAPRRLCCPGSARADGAGLVPVLARELHRGERLRGQPPRRAHGRGGRRRPLPGRLRYRVPRSAGEGRRAVRAGLVLRGRRPAGGVLAVPAHGGRERDAGVPARCVRHHAVQQLPAPVRGSGGGRRELARPEPDTVQRFSFYSNDMTSAGEADRYGAALNRLMDRPLPPPRPEPTAGRVRSPRSGRPTSPPTRACTGSRSAWRACPRWLPPLPPEHRRVVAHGYIVLVNRMLSTVAAIVLVTACSIIALKIHRSGRSPFPLLTGKNYNNRRDNIKEILGNYGSLAPRSYGMVYKGTVPDGRHVAVKFLHDTTGNGEEFVNEVISIRRTSHVNVVTLLGFCLEELKQTLGWEKLYEIAMGIARGLEYLHRGCNTRIIHFDIKFQNILLDQDFESYLMSMDGMRGTVGFIAPEVFSRRFGVVSTKSDVQLRMNLRASVERESEVYFPDWVHSHLTQFGSLQSFELGLDEPEEITKKMAPIGLWYTNIARVSPDDEQGSRNVREKDDSDEQQNES